MPALPSFRALRRLRIGTRLVLSSAVLILLLALPAMVTLTRLGELHRAFGRLASERLQLLHLASEVSLNASLAARKLLVLISAERPQRV